MDQMLAKAFVEISAKQDKFDAALGSIKSQLGGISSYADGITAAMHRWILPLASGSFLGWGVKLAAEAESAQTAFSTLLGSEEKAVNMLAQLQQFAASTPFEFPDLRDAAKVLVAFGIEQGDVMKDMRILGDIAAGTGKPIKDFVEIFGKVKATGRASMEEINRLAERGVPIFRLLAEIMGVDQSEMRKMIEKGKVGFPEIEAALTKVTSAGEMFGGGMAKLSQTTAGLWSTLMDNIKMVMTDLGTAMIEDLNFKGLLNLGIEMAAGIGDGLRTVRGWIRIIRVEIGEWYTANQEIIDSGLRFATMVGGGFAAVAAAAATLLAVGPMIGPALAVGFGIVTGPIGLIISGIIGIGAAIVYAYGEGETFSDKVNSLWGKIPDLIDTIGFAWRNMQDLGELAILSLVQTALSYFPQMEGPITSAAAIFVGTWQGVKAFFSSFVDNVIAGFKEIANFGKAVAAGIQAAWQAMKAGDFKGMASAFGEAFTNTLASQKDEQGGGNPFSAFGQAFKDGKKEFEDAIAGQGGLGASVQNEINAISQRMADREAEHAKSKEQMRTEETKKEIEQSEKKKDGKKKSSGSKDAVSFADFEGIWKKVQEAAFKNTEAQKQTAAAVISAEANEEQVDQMDDQNGILGEALIQLKQINEKSGGAAILG